MAPLNEDSDPFVRAPVRRSQRIAQRTSGKAPQYTPPPAPKLDTSPSKFDGPRPTWLTNPEEPSRPPPTPHGDAPEPHALPPLSSHALRSMPRAGGVAGMGISNPTTPKSKRPYTISYTDKRTREAQASSLSSESEDEAPNDTCRSPVEAAKVPAAPRIGPLDRGTFSPTRFPSPKTKLVHAAHPDANILKPPSFCDMARTHSMRREEQVALVALDKMTTDGSVVGLGITVRESKEKQTQDAVTNMAGELQRLTLKGNEPPRKVFGERRTNTLPTAATLTSKKEHCKGAQLHDKRTQKMTYNNFPVPRGVLDENGKPVAYKPPTKRYAITPLRKPRSSLAAPQVTHERTAFAVTCGYSRSAPHAHGKGPTLTTRNFVPLR